MSPAPGLMNSVCGWWRGSAAAEAPRPCDLVIGGGETLEAGAGTLALVRKCDRRPDGGRARTASLVQTAPALSLTADRGAWLARYCRPDSLDRTKTSSCPPTAYRSTPSWLQTRHGQEASPGRRLLPRDGVWRSRQILAQPCLVTADQTWPGA